MRANRLEIQSRTVDLGLKARDGRHRWYGDQKPVRCSSSTASGMRARTAAATRQQAGAHGLSHRVCTQTNGLVLDGIPGIGVHLGLSGWDAVAYRIELEPKFVDVAVNRYLAAMDQRRTYASSGTASGCRL